MATTSNTTMLRAAMDTTLRAFLNSYPLASSTANPKLLSTHLSPACLRHVYPASFLPKLGAPPDMTMDIESYAARFSGEMLASKCKRVDDISDVVIDTETRTAAARAKFTNEYTDNGEEVSLEFGWWFEFEEDGKKISKIKEFLDTIVIEAYQARMAKILEGLEKK